jgi:hypothetical protein
MVLQHPVPKAQSVNAEYYAPSPPTIIRNNDNNSVNENEI